MNSQGSVPAESSPTSPSTDGRRGRLQRPYTASGAEQYVTRVVRIPLERPDDAAWRELVGLAREGARFAQRLMQAWYVDAMSSPALTSAGEANVRRLLAWFFEQMNWPDPGVSPFREFKGQLSGDVRVAIQGEAEAVWRKIRPHVLRGDQRLAAFSSDRALVVRGEYRGGKGGVRLVRDGDGYSLELRLVGREVGPIHALRVWTQSASMRKDPYIMGLLDKVASGEYRCAKAILSLDRRRRKLAVRLAYERPVPKGTGAVGTATLGPLEKDGTLLLRSAHETMDVSHSLWEIREHKKHHAGIVRRLRMALRKRPDRRRRYRRAREHHLPTDYTEWARGKVHVWSAKMVKWLVERRVSELTLAPIDDGEWPAHILETQLKYKCEEASIGFSKIIDPRDPATGRAVESPIRKAQKQAARSRKAVRTLEDALKKGK